MLACFSGSVTLSGGRTVSVHPARQIVWPIVAGVTAGLSAPGVQRGSGRENSPVPRAWQDPGAGCACTCWAETVETTSPDAAGACGRGRLVRERCARRSRDERVAADR